MLAKLQAASVLIFSLENPSTNPTLPLAESILDERVLIGDRVRPAFRIEESPMQDLTMLFYTVIFFAAAFLYVKACQKLR